jgi:hypothetical protein
MSQSNHDVLNAAHPDEWARAEHLLPGYLKKTLSASDQGWMKQWISQIETAGGVPAEALESEITWVRAAQDDLGGQATHFNAQTGWQKLQAELQSELAAKATVNPSSMAVPIPSLHQKFRQWLAKLARMQQDRALQWWQKPAFGALASAMIVGQMGFLVATVKQVYVLTTDTTMVTPSSGASRPVDGALLKVIFKPNASVKDIMATLNSIQGRVTGGPGALGIWEVEVPTDKLPNALQLQGKSKTVESVTQE